VSAIVFDVGVLIPDQQPTTNYYADVAAIRVSNTLGRVTNAPIFERTAQRDRSTGPSRQDIVTEIRRLRRDS